jgi:multisubunit Na+/H+ antiporter MnhF subunit
VMAGLYFLASSLWLPIALAISLVGFLTTAVFLARVFQRRSGRAFKLR